MSSILVSLIAATSYAGAAAIEARHIRAEKREHKPAFVAIMALALVLHLHVALPSIGNLNGGWQLSLLDMLSLSAWIIGALALILRLRQNQGFLLAPLLVAVAAITAISPWSGEGGRSVASSLSWQPHHAVLGGFCSFNYGWDSSPAVGLAKQSTKTPSGCPSQRTAITQTNGTVVVRSHSNGLADADPVPGYRVAIHR